MKGPDKAACIAFGLLVVISSSTTCLHDAFPEEFMQNITFAGNSTPVKVMYATWASSHLLGEISAIIIRERMGFNAVVVDLPAISTSAKTEAALADCITFSASDCKQNLGPPGVHGHMALEVWEYYASGARATLLATVPERLPVYVGFPEGLGYGGKESMYIRGDIVPQARAAHVYLEWYETYNASWPVALDYFANHRDLPEPTKPCSTVQLLNGPYLDSYLDATGDVGAARLEDGVKVPDCRDEWMLSKTCRERVAAGQGCIPVVSYLGWGYEAFLQLSYFHDMPIAFGAYTEASSWTTIPAQNSVLFYWWFPDTAFLHLEAREIQFPPANLDEQNLGVYRTMVEGMRVFKGAHTELPGAAPLLNQFLKNMKLSIQTITALIRPYGEKEAHQLACEWIHANEAIWTRWVPDPNECFPGQGLEVDAATGRNVCDWCRPGFKSEQDANLTYRCVKCPLGESQPSVGAQECAPCEVGKFAAGNGSTSCTDCLIGSYADKVRASNCTPCREGESTFELFSNVQGVSSWTPVRGASNASMCGCDVGMRREENTGSCVACTEGLDCRGMDHVFIKPGYYTPGHELSIFRCWTDEQRCLGGPPGGDMCNVGRTALTCSMCEDGKMSGDNGACKECGGLNLLPFVLACLLGLIVVCVLYKVVDGANLVDRNAIFALLMCEASMFVLFVQQLGVLGKLSMQFPEPFRGLLRLASFFNFDFEILQLGCIRPGLNPTLEYAVQMASILILLLTICLLHVVTVVVRYHGKFTERIYSLTGTIGTLFMIFLTSMVNAAVVPFESQDHPNGLATVRRYPAVITWDDDHYPMVALAIPYLSIPISFVAFIASIVYRFPRAMSRGDVGFLQRYAIFFRRFSPGQYWYILFFVLRNTIVAMSPAFPDVLVQVLVNTMLVTVSFGILARFLPWVAEVANQIDFVIHLALVIFMSMVGFFADDASPTTIGITATVFIVLVLLAFAGGLATIAYRKIIYREHAEWRYFLCHHKGGAGAVARLLKLVFLQKDGNKKLKVWLDCDNLTNMEKLFDYVGDSDSVVVLMSSELFLRPWCMGELVTAHRRNVQTIPVKFPNCVPMTDEFIENYAEHVDISCLSPFAIQLDMVQTMLQFVRERPAVNMPTTLNNGTVLDVSNLIERSLLGKSANMAQQVSIEKAPANIQNIVIADHSNLESVATALVLVHYVRMETSAMSMIPHVLDKQEGLPKSAACCVFVLTNGAFSEPCFVKAMLAAVGTRFLPIIAEDSFRFPSQAMLDEIFATAESRLRPYGIEEDPEEIVSVIANVFKEIAVVFSPQNYSSNHDLLKTKAKAIRTRLVGSSLQALSANRRHSTTSRASSTDTQAMAVSTTSSGEGNGKLPSEEGNGVEKEATHKC